MYEKCKNLNHILAYLDFTTSLHKLDYKIIILIWVKFMGVNSRSVFKLIERFHSDSKLK